VANPVLDVWLSPQAVLREAAENRRCGCCYAEADNDILQGQAYLGQDSGSGVPVQSLWAEVLDTDKEQPGMQEIWVLYEVSPAPRAVHFKESEG